jgi:hypothetical protein
MREEAKTLPGSRVLTKKYRIDARVRQSPFGNHSDNCFRQESLINANSIR